MTGTVDPIYFGLVPVPPVYSASSPKISPLDAAIQLHKSQPEWTPLPRSQVAAADLNINDDSRFTLTAASDGIPPLNEDLNGAVPTPPQNSQQVSPEAAIPGYLDVHRAEQIGRPDEHIPEQETETYGYRAFTPDEELYKRRVINKLTTTYMKGTPDLGFRDGHGYVIEINKDGPTQLGEGYYFTAIAAAAFAMNNYQSEIWEVQTNNQILEGLLNVLDEVSWTDPDSSGVRHPVRHVDMWEWHTSGVVRQRPISKDAFGPMVAACYYAYNCPNSTSTVRNMAKSLLTHWVTYLSTNNWMLHSKHLQGEFVTEDDKEFKGYYKNLRSYDKEHEKITGRIRYLGAESFILMPYELYAFKHCADSLGVPNSIWPWVNTSLALGSSIGPQLMAIVAPVAKRGMKAVLDSLFYSKGYSIEFIPNIKAATLRGTLQLSIPESVKEDICNTFEKALYDSADQNWFDPNAQHRGSRSMFRNPISSITDMFPAMYRRLPNLASILEDLMAQAMPWAETDFLSEYLAFETAFDVKFGGKLTWVLLTTLNATGGLIYEWKIGSATESPPDDSLAGYTFWSMLVEMEARPLMRFLLRPLANGYYSSMSGRGNRNGLWAWLIGDAMVVSEAIMTFMSRENEVYDWKAYAWAKNYNEWVSEPRGSTSEEETGKKKDEGSSRLDYLVLRGLTQVQVPATPVISIDSLKYLIDAVEDLIKDIIQRAIDEFNRAGKYLQVAFDVAGQAIEDVMEAGKGLTRTIYKESQKLSKTIHHIGGEIEQWRYDAGEALKGYTKWAKGNIDALTPFYDVIEYSTRDIANGALKIWKLADNKVTEVFHFATSAIDGAFQEVHKVLQIFREASGALHQWIMWNGVLKSYLGWAASGVFGQVEAVECIMHILRDPAGQLRKWEYEVGHVLKTFNHWLSSNPLGNSDPSKLLQSCLRLSGGALVQTLFDAGTFKKEFIWATSNIEGVARSTDCVIHQLRKLDGSLQQWTLERGVPKEFKQWAVSAGDGSASENNLVKAISKLPGGNLQVLTFNAGIQVGKKVFSETGKVLEDTQGALGDAGEAAKRAGGRLSNWAKKRLGF